jgi:hypothetical protein
MRKLFTFSIFSFLTLVFFAFSTEYKIQNNDANQNETYKNGGDDPNDPIAKKNFWTQYQNYKNFLISNPTKVMNKPIDPTGKFYIDGFGNFSVKPKEDPIGFQNILPPHNPQPDAVSGYTWSQPAGVSGYTWSQPTGTFTTIVGGGGTVLIGSGFDDNVWSALPIGFTFTLNGVAYTTFGGNANGWISMGSTVPFSSYTPLSSGTTNVISAFSADLRGLAAGNGIYYQTSGAVGSRVLTVEFVNWGFYPVGSSEINFQIKLFETSNNIQIIYKPNVPSTTSSLQVGLGGATTADYNNRTTTTNWSATTAGAVNTAACTFTSAIFPAANLTFQWSPVGYTPIVGTTVATGAVDDGSSGALPIGFSFTYDGTAYTTFGIAFNGYIMMGSSLPNGNNYTGLSGSDNNIIAPMGVDLQGTATGRIEYLTAGAVGSRVLTVQFSNWGFYNGTADGNFNCQVQLFETSNIIRIVYGTCAAGSFSHSPTIGLRGASSADFNNRTTATNWSATTAGAFITDICTYASGVLPATNLTFQWAPPAGSPMTYVSSTTVQVQNGVPVAAIPAGLTNNQIVQIQVVTSGNLSPFSVTGFSLGTNGSINPPTDITNAKVYYTGTSNVFSTATLVGTTLSPNGTFPLSGSQALASGTNYFWLTYDVPGTATYLNLLDAQCNTITGTGTMGVRVPTTIAPAGSRFVDKYCVGQYSLSGATFALYISNVTLVTINNTTGFDPNVNFPYAYNYYPALSTNLTQGNNYTISVSEPSSSNPNGFSVWIDWNQNGSFTDAGEYFNLGLLPLGGTNTITGTISVPAGATLGTTRMRVRSNYSSAPLSTDACTTLIYGETEDYPVNILPFTGPANPTSFIATPFSSSQINLSWVLDGSSDPVMLAWNSTNTFGTPVNGTVYSVGNVIPGGGTVLYDGSGLAYNHTGLAPGTTYYYKIWSVNGTIQYSSGVTANAATPCGIISSLPYAYGFGTTGTLDPCWSIQQVAGTGNWALATSMSFPTMAPFVPPYMAYFNSFNFSAGAQSRLKTPAFNFTGVPNPRVGFYMTRDNGEAGFYDSILVEVSVDGGATWTGIYPAYQRYLASSAGLWEKETVNLNAYGGNSNVIIGFRACSAFGDNMAIDSITVIQALSGGYTVGTGGNYPTLTGAGGLFSAINASLIAGNITATILSDITEPGTFQLNATNETSPGGYTITIQPATGTLKTISGNFAGGLITFNGSHRIIIDGNGGFSSKPQNKIITKGIGKSDNINSAPSLQNKIITKGIGKSDNVNSAPSKYLLFRNINGSNPTFMFLNEARRNTITNCYIESNNATLFTGVAPGTINFGSTTGVGGNDSNTISFCDIRDRSDAAGIPAYGIFSLGNITTVPQYNSDIIISSNNIYNYGLDNGSFSSGIWFENGSLGWTISGNSFYQTSTRTMTLAGALHAGIFVDFNSQYGFTVTGNYFGGTAPLCGGTALTYTGAVTFTVEGFDLFVGGQSAGQTATSVQNNTIQNINLTSSAATGSSNFFRGIRATSTLGLVNIGDVTGNTIGNQTSTGNITLTTNTTASPYLIYCIERDGWGTVSNNTIGSITLGGTSTSVNFRGIAWPLTVAAATTITISNNVIGGTVANSIQQLADPLRTTSSRGISVNAVNAPGTLNCTGNTVQNWTFGNSSSTVTSTLNGIQTLGTGIHNVTGNTVHDLSLATGYAAFTNMLCGFQPAGTGVNTISQNTVYNLSLTNTGAFSSFMEGLLVTGGASGSTVSRNKVYNLTNQQTGAAPTIVGIGFFNAVSVFANVTNNMITLTNGELTDRKYNPNIKIDNSGTDNSRSTIRNDKKSFKNNNDKTSLRNSNTPIINNPEKPLFSERNVYTPVQEKGYLNTKQNFEKNVGNVVNYENSAENHPVDNKIKNTDGALSTNGMVIQGFEDYSLGTLNFFYNTVYVGGTAVSGTNNSAAFFRYFGSDALNFRNNLFVNARTGGAGKHYVVSNQVGATGWTAAASNYNVFLGSNASTIGEWLAGIDQTIAQWRTSSGGEQQTWSTTTSIVNPVNLFTSISGGNLNIQSGNTEAWLVSGKGIAIAGQNSDYSGNVRVMLISAGCTDIGANEFAATPPSNPVAAQDIAPGSGVTSTYTLWGRTIATIDWGTGGTSYPAGINVNYFSGVNPSNVLGGNYSNSHTTIVPTLGTLAGAAYNLTYYFGDNETGTITSPNTNTILAKYNPTSWEVFQPGGGVYQTQLVWNAGSETYTAKVIGLYNFSDFALTDVSSALPVQICSFTGGAANRNVTLNWTTCLEINNKGFDIERRMQTDGATNTFTPWVKAGYLEGHGTTNEQQSYSFKDIKMAVGKFQYRLKQIDYNGNTEYYNLTSPSLVEIGKPANADISQNYPNPSNPKSKIDYQIPFNGKVSLKVYDLVGREVASIVNEVKEAGFYTAEFDGTNLASGVYFYRILAEGEGQKFIQTKKMVLVK